MSYQVLARKYRPRTFDEVVGQDAVADTLRRAVEQDRIHHAFLFTGPRGTGKTSMARILARSLNCLAHDAPSLDPCNDCDVCVAVARGEDLDVIEIDGASNNSVDDVRELRGNVLLRPARSRFKVYIVDEVHMLSRAAFNAFLKTLEEPPPHVKFVFATTELHKVPETIVSRCQRHDFRRIPTADIRGVLERIAREEGAVVDDAVLEAVAVRARGGLRDAQSLLDQLITHRREGVTLEDLQDVLGVVPRQELLELCAAVFGGRAADVLRRADGFVQSGKDPGLLVEETLDTLRQVMAVKTAGRDTPLAHLTDAERGPAAALAEAVSLDTLVLAVQVLGGVRGRMRGFADPRIPLELALLQLCRVGELVDLDTLVRRLERLEGTAGAAVPADLAPRSSGAEASTASAAPAAPADEEPSAPAADAAPDPGPPAPAAEPAPEPEQDTQPTAAPAAPATAPSGDPAVAEDPAVERVRALLQGRVVDIEAAAPATADDDDREDTP